MAAAGFNPDSKAVQANNPFNIFKKDCKWVDLLKEAQQSNKRIVWLLRESKTAGMLSIDIFDMNGVITPDRVHVCSLRYAFTPLGWEEVSEQGINPNEIVPVSIQTVTNEQMERFFEKIANINLTVETQLKFNMLKLNEKQHPHYIHCMWQPPEPQSAAAASTHPIQQSAVAAPQVLPSPPAQQPPQQALKK